jgi:hypothetical protein
MRVQTVPSLFCLSATLHQFGRSHLVRLVRVALRTNVTAIVWLS